MDIPVASVAKAPKLIVMYRVSIYKFTVRMHSRLQNMNRSILLLFLDSLFKATALTADERKELSRALIQNPKAKTITRHKIYQDVCDGIEDFEPSSSENEVKELIGLIAEALEKNLPCKWIMFVRASASADQTSRPLESITTPFSIVLICRDIPVGGYKLGNHANRAAMKGLCRTIGL